MNFDDYREEPRRRQEQWHFDNQFHNPKFNIPRFDFPTFNGDDPSDWVEESNFYFDVNQTSEMYKVRMTTMYFKGDAKEWYKSYKIAKPEPPWPILIEEVMKYFSKVNSNPVADFRRSNSKGTLRNTSNTSHEPKQGL